MIEKKSLWSRIKNRIRTREGMLSGIASGVALQTALAGAAPVEQETEKPNVLFLAIDDLNMWVNALGHPLAHTPNLDRLAEQGILFENHYASAAVCGPSRAAMISGMFPSTTGVYENNQRMNDSEVIQASVPWPAHMRAQGYSTHRIGKVVHWDHLPEWEVVDGWDEAVDYLPESRTVIPERFYALDGVPNFGPLSAWQNLNEEEVAEFAEQRLAGGMQEPFLMALGFVRPKAPKFAPVEFYDMYPLEELSDPDWTEDDLADLPPRALDIIGLDNPNRLYPLIDDAGVHREFAQAELANISFVDYCIGRVLDALEDGPYEDNTIIILWSDHGTHMGEQMRYGKSTVWRAAARSPLIIIAPGITPSDTRYSYPVSSIDLYPTIMDLCDLPSPPHTLEGESLVPVLADPTLPGPRPVLTTMRFREHGIRKEQWGYLRYRTGDEELYDYSVDPEERVNLAADPAYTSVIEELSGYLPAHDEPPIEAFDAGIVEIETTLDLEGDPRDAGNWNEGLPDPDRWGLIPQGLTATIDEEGSVTYAAALVIEGAFERIGDGAMIFGANSQLIVEDGGLLETQADHLRINRGPLTVNTGTVASAGNVDLYGTGIFDLTMNGGTLTAGGHVILDPNTDADPINARYMRMRDGSVTGNELRLLKNAYLYFDGEEGSISVTGLEISGDSYINFFEDSHGTLSVSGYSETDFQSLYDAGTLLYEDENEGPFEDHFMVLGSTLMVKRDLPPENTMMLSGDPRDAENWSQQVPDTDTAGYIPSGIEAVFDEPENVTFPAVLVVGGTLEQAGAGSLIFGANSSITVEEDGLVRTLVGSSHFRINRGPLTVNGGTVDSAGNVDLYGTGQMDFTMNAGTVMAGGNIVMNPNLDPDPENARHMRVRGGTVTGDELRLYGNAFLYFDGDGGRVTVQSLDITGDSYINFVGDTLGALMISDFSESDYEALFNDERLRYNGETEGSFEDHFVLTAAGVALKDALPVENTMMVSGDPRVEENWSAYVPDTDNAGYIPDGITATFDESENVTFPAILTIGGVLEQTGAGSLIFGANSSITVEDSGLVQTLVGGSHFRINRGPLTVNGGTVDSAGNVDLYGTGQMALTLNDGTISAAGNLVMNPNLTGDPDASRHMRVRGGAVSGGELRLFGNSFLYFDGAGGTVDVLSLDITGNSYINFEAESGGALTIASFSESDFADLFGDGRLLYEGTNEEAFSNHFEVADSTLTLRVEEPYQSYEAWADEAGIPSDQRGWDDDPFGTGIKNLEAYITGIPQEEPVQGPLAIRIESGLPVITFPWRTGISPNAWFAVEASDDLESWLTDENLVWDSEPLDEGRLEMQGEQSEPDNEQQQHYRVRFGLSE